MSFLIGAFTIFLHLLITVDLYKVGNIGAIFCIYTLPTKVANDSSGSFDLDFILIYIS